jgi:tRNA(fMet)-specific endonuclease VapC
MMRYMLDTNTVSYFMRGDRHVEQAVLAIDYPNLCVSCITEAEMLYGLARRPDATRKARLAREFLDRVESLPWGREQAAVFGQTRARMEASGKSLGPVDMLIAAHALSIGATLVTSDRAFQHVPGLDLENWS